MSISVIATEKFCENIGCENPITGFALKHNKRFCMKCQWGDILRWKCHRKGCNTIIYPIKHNTSKIFCSNECCVLARHERYENSVKQKKLIKQQAAQTYEYFIKSNIPLYKITYINQLLVKLAILDFKQIHLTKAKKRKISVITSLKYQKVHSKKYLSYQREYWHIITRQKFVKFFDRIESA